MFKIWETLRKFGLEYCDLPTMIWNVDKLLRWLSLATDRRNNRPLPNICRIFTVITSGCYFYIYIVSMIWFVFWRCRETGDILSGIIVFSLSINGEIGLWKLIFMHLYEKRFRMIVEGYLEFDASVTGDSRFGRNLAKLLRNLKKRALIFFIVINGDGILYLMCNAVIPSGRHTLEDCFIYLGLEPMLESPNYEIVMTISILALIFITYAPSTIALMFILLAGYTEAFMLSLSEELVNVWQDAQTHYDETKREEENCEDANKIMNEYVKGRLEYIIRCHTTNSSLLREIENVFSTIMTVEFLLLTIGVITALIGDLKKTFLELPYGLMLVGMDCFIGQRVMDAGFVFENAVYDSNWENFDVPNRKMILLMLVKSQKTMMLSIGGVKSLSFATLMSVIRMIYSAYNVLRTVF